MDAVSRFARWVEWVGSQEKAAEAVGCKQPHVSAIVNGHKTPGLKIAHAIHAAMSRPGPNGEVFAEEPIPTHAWIPDFESTGTEG